MTKAIERKTLGLGIRDEDRVRARCGVEGLLLAGETVLEGLKARTRLPSDLTASEIAVLKMCMEIGGGMRDGKVRGLGVGESGEEEEVVGVMGGALVELKRRQDGGKKR